MTMLRLMILKYPLLAKCVVGAAAVNTWLSALRKADLSFTPRLAPGTATYAVSHAGDTFGRTRVSVKRRDHASAASK